MPILILDQSRDPWRDNEDNRGVIYRIPAGPW